MKAQPASTDTGRESAVDPGIAKRDPVPAGGPVRLGASLLGVGALWLALTVLGQLPLSWPRGTPAQVATMFGAAVAGAVLWRIWFRGLHRWLTSVPFAVATMAVLLLLTALGTFVLQGLPAQELAGRYGKTMAGVLRRLLLNDIFHSLVYRGFLVLLALALILVAIKRRTWRRPEWGFLLSHVGIVVILAGGLVGSLWGMKGFIDIHEGQVVTEMQLTGRQGERLKKQVPLGFGLRLDKFELERYPLEYRFYVWEEERIDCPETASDKRHSEPEVSYRKAASYSLKDAAKWRAIGDSEVSFRLLNAYPDFQMHSKLQESSSDSARPAVQLRLYERDGSSRPLVLLAGVDGRDVVAMQKPAVTLRFVWNAGDYKPSGTERVPERHTLGVQDGSHGSSQEIGVAIGETYRVGGYELRAVAFLPDFIYDTQKREGATRSSQPNNPALRVSVRKEGGDAKERWLFSRMPDYDHGGGQDGPKLVYKYQAGYEPPERELVIVGKTTEVVEYRRGVEAGRAAVKIGGTDEEPISGGVNIACDRIVERGEEVHIATSRSNEWRRPVAEIERRAGEDGEVTREYLAAGQPLRGGEHGPVLVLGKKEDDIRAYRSRVSVVEEGRTAHSAALLVNSPLSWKGFQFYQSNYRAEDPTYSGILVVKDPGLPLVYAGFVMISLGVIFIFYVKPHIVRASVAAKRSAS